MSDKIIVAGYARVSTPSQAKVGESIPEQKRMIENFAASHGWGIFKIYADEGISGKKDSRPALDELLKDAQNDKFKKVIFSKLDRFGRTVKQILNHYEFLEKQKIALVSIKENLDTGTPMGRVFRTLLAAFAEFEWETIRERTISGLGGYVGHGRPLGKTSLGYVWNKAENKFEINPGEVELYKDIVFLFLEKHLSTGKIAEHLNNKNLRTRFGKRYTQPTIAHILKAKIYKGEFEQNFQGEIHKIKTPPLISQKQWDLIQKRLDENKTKSKNYEGSAQWKDFFLRDLLRCGECGYGIYPKLSGPQRGDGTGRLRHYACHAATRMKPNRSNNFVDCKLPYIKAEEIETLVMSEIIRYFQFPENLIRLWKDRNKLIKKDEIQGKLKGLKIKLGTLESARRKLLDDFVIKTFDRKMVQGKDRELEVGINSIREEIAEKETSLNLMETKEKDFQTLTEMKTELKKLWPTLNKTIAEMTPEQKKGFIQSALSGEKLSVKIVRRRDVADSEKELSQEDLNEPIYRKYHDKKIPEWTVEGSWLFNLENAAEYLKPLVQYQSKYPPAQAHS